MRREDSVKRDGIEKLKRHANSEAQSAIPRSRRIPRRSEAFVRPTVAIILTYSWACNPFPLHGNRALMEMPITGIIQVPRENGLAMQR